jgi:hypothetical protein
MKLKEKLAQDFIERETYARDSLGSDTPIEPECAFDAGFDKAREMAARGFKSSDRPDLQALHDLLMSMGEEEI